MAELLAHSDALRALATPCLVVDGDALSANIERMASAARRAGIALRPHAKTHKSPEIAGLQIEAGAIGICCATIAEAEMLAPAGIPGLLLTTPVMGDQKFERLAHLNRSHGCALVVDHPDQIAGLLRAMRAGDPPCDVLVDIDVGQRRTGVVEIGDVVTLAQSVAAQPALAFRGIQGFAGNAQHIPNHAERQSAADAATAKLRQIARALADAGLEPKTITGSGTGTYLSDATGPYTELQVGSYVFMDAEYAGITDEHGTGPSFLPSLFVLATVVSVNRPGEVTVDAGTKALATNGPMPAVILGAPPGARYRFAGDEHGILTIPPGSSPPALGSRVLIGATHCDPTANLHAAYHVLRSTEWHEWPIRGRYGE